MVRISTCMQSSKDEPSAETKTVFELSSLGVFKTNDGGKKYELSKEDGNQSTSSSPRTACGAHAWAISSGCYTSRLGMDKDFLVRWSDGELSVYADIRENEVSRKTHVLPPQRALDTHLARR